MLDANPESIVLHPLIPMAQFNKNLGATPSGANRYRVIWAPSRKIQRFLNGVSETISAYEPGGIEPINQRLTPQHKQGECWILEQWVNPYRDCSEQEWNTVPCIQISGVRGLVTRLQAMGPFPRQGYYWHSDNTYLIGEPTVSQVEKMILFVEDGMFRHTEWDNYVAIRNKVEKGEKQVETTVQDRIKDRMLIGGGEAWSSGHGHRGTKTINTKRTSRDLARRGFSTKPGTVSVTPRRRKVTYDLSPFIK